MNSRAKTAVALASIAALLATAALASAEITQRGNLRVAVNGKLAPTKLPRTGAAPIAVAVKSQITTTDETQPPKLRGLRIEINRNGRLSTAGLPVCPYGSIRTATSAQALKACRSALVGSGSLEANVVLATQEPYPTKSRLLLFNGRIKRKPVLLGQVFSARPFANSFVIVFKISRTRRGTYGTVLSATLPAALRSWGVVTGIEMNLSRRYRVRGKRRSFLASGCPAPRGFPRATFPLARTTFGFTGGPRVVQTLTRSCRARG